MIEVCTAVLVAGTFDLIFQSAAVEMRKRTNAVVVHLVEIGVD